MSPRRLPQPAQFPDARWEQQRGRYLRLTTTLLAVGLLVASAAHLSFDEVAHDLGYSAAARSTGLSLAVLALRMLPAALQAVALFLLGWRIGALKGGLFVRETEWALGRFAKWLLASAFFGTFGVFAASLLLASGPAGSLVGMLVDLLGIAGDAAGGAQGQQLAHLVVEVGAGQVVAVTLAMVAWCCAHLAAAGRLLQEENAAFV